MNIVNKLPQHVADLIAAGEVVERPASVVKELVENAIDAGALSITVEISNGGIDLIRVTDNGCGMTRDDAQTCFIRHATSKIKDEADLHAILTLGFRGEALAAISSVSQVELVTRLIGDDVGTRVTLNAGVIETVDDAGCPEGTTISVSKIFYNTPARMKFLKKNATEAGYCQAAAEHAALSHPEIAFHFIKDGRAVFHTPGDNKLMSAVYAVCGRDFASSLIPFRSKPVESVGGTAVTVWGYITRPEKALSSRNSQYFILNGRYIRSRSMGAALEEAYQGSIMVGKYPGCVIHAAADPSYVDVNVHPAKTEIKFADERAVFETLYVAVRSALDSNTQRPEFNPSPVEEKSGENVTIPAAKESVPLKKSEDVHEYAPMSDYRNRIESNKRLLKSDLPPIEALKVLSGIDISASDFDASAETVKPPVFTPAPAPVITEETVSEALEEIAGSEDAETIQETLIPPVEEKTEFRIVGEIFDSYIIVELPGEVMYIDKHAAHERIIYNELKASDTLPPPQLLLEPVVITVSREDEPVIEEHLKQLIAAGIELEDFGSGSMAIQAIPPYIEPSQAAELIEEICSRVRTGTDSVREDILHSIACKAAIKAGWKTDPAEREVLVRKVLTFPDVRYCPHGRPVAIVTSKREFEKGFKRT